MANLKRICLGICTGMLAATFLVYHNIGTFYGAARERFADALAFVVEATRKWHVPSPVAVLRYVSSSIFGFGGKLAVYNRRRLDRIAFVDPY